VNYLKIEYKDVYFTRYEGVWGSGGTAALTLNLDTG